MSKTSHETDLMEGEVCLRLEDFGQDFLYFIVKDDTITGCGPFQASVWVGQKIEPRKKWRKGMQVVFQDGMVLKYRVAKAEL